MPENQPPLKKIGSHETCNRSTFTPNDNYISEASSNNQSAWQISQASIQFEIGDIKSQSQAINDLIIDFGRQCDKTQEFQSLVSNYQIQPARFDFQCQTTFQSSETSQVSKLKSKSKKFEKKKSLSPFLMSCLFALYCSLANIPIFFTEESQEKYYFLISFTIIMNVFFVSYSLSLAKSFKEFILITFLLDNIIITQIVSSIGYVGLLKIYFSGRWYQWVQLVNVPLLYLFSAGNVRLLLLNYDWSRPKTILYKIILMIGAIFYFLIGAMIMFVTYKVTGGMDPQKDERFKDFAILFTFGNFAFYYELYDKISQFDKSHELIADYKIIIKNYEDNVEDQSFAQLKKDEKDTESKTPPMKKSEEEVMPQSSKFLNDGEQI